MSSDNHRQNGPDIVDAAFDALRATRVSADPPLDVVASTMGALENRLAAIAPQSRVLRPRRKKILRYLGFGSLATAAAVLAFVLVSGFGHSTASLAGAFEKVQQAQAVKFRMRTTFQSGQTNTSDVTLSGNKLRAAGAVGAGITWILDWDAKGAILINKDRRIYQTMDMTNGGIAPFGSPGMNVREELLALRNQQATLVGPETIEGETADKYSILGGKAFYEEGDWEIWIGRRSGLPVKVSAKITLRGITTVHTYDSFDWNVKPDPAEFSIDPPDGFEERIILGLAPQLPPRKK